MPKEGPRQKAAARAAANEAEKAAREAEQEELRQQTIWAVGSDKKGAKKQQSAQNKAEEQARKAKEKADLLAAEEEATSGIKREKPNKPAKGGAKKKDNFDALQAALASRPKTKAEKEKERKAREKELQQKKDLEAQKAKAERLAKEEKERREALERGITIGHGDALMAAKPNNQAIEVTEDVTEKAPKDAQTGAVTEAMEKVALEGA